MSSFQSTPVQGEQDPDMQVEWYVSPVDGNNTYVLVHIPLLTLAFN